MMSLLMELVRMESAHYVMTVMNAESILQSMCLKMPSYQNQEGKKNISKVILSMIQGKTNFCIIHLIYSFQNYIKQFEFVDYFYPNYPDPPQLSNLSPWNGPEHNLG